MLGLPGGFPRTFAKCCLGAGLAPEREVEPRPSSRSLRLPLSPSISTSLTGCKIFRRNAVFEKLDWL